MTFKITAKEKKQLIRRRKAKSQGDETYFGIIGKLRASINVVADSLRDLENYMVKNPGLKEKIEDDFDKVEKAVFDTKGLIKKMDKLKVVRKENSED